MTSLICWVSLDHVNKNDFLMSSFYETNSVDFHLYWMSNDVSLEETGGGNTQE